jgi:DNA-binding HxlR family transcriptional regulator
MKQLSPVNQHCGIARSLEVLGERWTLLVVRDVRLGVTRFRDIRERLGIAPDMLADRLAKLVDLGVLERRGYREEGARAREEYVLTPAGEELAPVLVALQAWGDRHLPNGLTPGSRTVDASTGEPVHVGFVDAAGQELGLDRLRVERVPAEDVPAA